MSVQVPELDAQYRILREEAGLLERDDLAVIRVSGSEAAEFLQGQLTNDVEALATGESCYAALLDRKGKVQADAQVLRVADGDYLLLAEAAFAPTLNRHLGTYNIGRDALVEAMDETAVVTVAGPASEALLGTPLGAAGNHREIEIGGVRARAVASWIGADLLLDAEDPARLLEILQHEGGERVGADALEVARVEAGIPRVGREIDSSTIPEEAGINERAVSFTKGCYIGQETVARLHYKGKPNRHLRRLRLDGPAAAGDPISIGDKQVGVVGTAVVSPAHGPLALAIVRREAEPGSRVTVGESVGATVEEIQAA